MSRFDVVNAPGMRLIPGRLNALAAEPPTLHEIYFEFLNALSLKRFRIGPHTPDAVVRSA